ncbi:MAG: GNAT family N-acetyltransferase [Haloferacaceae archaeon]
MTSLRPARPADRPRLLGLQSLLPDPAPDLLGHGLRTGGVLVADDGTPVAYLLAVGVTFGAARGPRETGGVPARIDPVETSDAGRTGVGTAGRPASNAVEPSGRATAGEADGDAPEGGEAAAHLAELVVAPDRRRRGHGGALLDALLARADRVTVRVAPDNEAALALYRSRGFERVGREPDAFADGPALVLATTT